MEIRAIQHEPDTLILCFTIEFEAGDEFSLYIEKGAACDGHCNSAHVFQYMHPFRDLLTDLGIERQKVAGTSEGWC